MLLWYLYEMFGKLETGKVENIFVFRFFSFWFSFPASFFSFSFSFFFILQICC